MNFRATFKDGVIIPSEPVSLRDGADIACRVVPRVSRAKRATKGRGSRPARTRMTAQQRVDALMQGFGIMRDAPEWTGKTSVQIAAELRARALGG